MKVAAWSGLWHREKNVKKCNKINIIGGESGIRTRVTVSRKHTFQACAFNHSATSPSLHSRRPVLPSGLGRCIPLGSAGETRVTGAANQRMPFPAPVNQTGAGLI